MFNRRIAASILTAWAAWGQSAPPAPPMTVARLYDSQLKSIESELVSLADAVPADKYSFAPTQGAFTNARTFAQQVKHVATTLYMLGAALQKEKTPIDRGPDENGPASISGKEQVLQYLKDAF